MHRAELLEEIARRYGVAAEYPWRRYPQYAVFRHAGNRKWFAVLMNPPGRKLGLATEDEVAILNVKIRAGENSLLRGMDAVLPADLPALVATLTHHIADLSAPQDNLADSLAAYPPITPPNLCVGWVHQMNDRRFTLAMLPTIMHEHPDRISAELNFDAFLELSHSDRETLLANEDSARLLREQLRHDAYRGPWRDETHEDWGERYGLLACQHYLKSKTRVPDDNYERLAASLPVNDHIAALITERLRTLPTDHPKHEDIAELAEYYRQKSRFAALLP